MATRFTNALVSLVSSDASFRANCQFIEDTLVTTGGWLVTADTGQTLISAMTFPAGATLKKGYRIYKSNDGITPQIFMRLNYGSNAWNTPPYGLGVWVTLGTGSDGAGNITGVLMNGETGFIHSTIATIGVSAVGLNNPCRCYGSAAPGRFAIAMFINAADVNCCIFSLERTKDANGNDTGAGLIFCGCCGGTSSFPFAINPTGNLQGNLYLNTAGGIQPTWEQGFSYILTRNNPSEIFTPGDIGLGIHIPIKGVAQQPVLNWLFCTANDVSAEGTVNTNIYGAARTYQHLNAPVKPGKSFTGAISSTDNNARCLMRFD